MPSNKNLPLVRRAALISLVIILLCAGIFALISAKNKKTPEQIIPVDSEAEQVNHEVIGISVEGRDIEAYTYGKGDAHLLFVGGIHGGYEWNSILLAYQFIDYLEENPDAIPENLTVSVIPSANPDGAYRAIGKEGRFTVSDLSDKELAAGTGRLNAHNVDINRNFDCKWKPEGMWRNTVVSAGTKAFSEPEAAAIRDFVLKFKPDAAIFWHSQANAVYASECKEGILLKTLDIMNAYAKATGYAALTSFDDYEISGDADGWLASINIPAISVELKNHEDVEWERNLLGIQALFKYFSQ